MIHIFYTPLDERSRWNTECGLGEQATSGEFIYYTQVVGNKSIDIFEHRSGYNAISLTTFKYGPLGKKSICPNCLFIIQLSE